MSRRPLPLAFLLTACSAEPLSDTGAPALTWHRDAAPVVAAKCGGCHVDGGIGSFALTTHAEVAALAGPVENAIASGAMPPWQGGDDCNDYRNDFSLSDQEKALLLAWLADGAPEGDPADAAAIEPRAQLQVDLELPLPEPYTPTREPDDYRCQLVDWPLSGTSWITGLEVQPDQADIVHHAIVFAASASQAELFRDMDAQEDGPGYTCFGGPTNGQSDGLDLSELSLEELTELLESGEVDLSGGGTRWLGAWVPGVEAAPLPEGTGLRMDEGDVLIVQLHYNTQSADPTPDHSVVGVQVADSVERPAMVLPFTDLGWVTGLDTLGGAMDIPAGAAEVVHDTSAPVDGRYFDAARNTLGLPEDSDLLVHQAGHHMHLLGTTGHQEIRHADGDSTCLVDVPDWDFSWQGGFALAEPARIEAGDELYLRCSWDNSADNQPIVDGAVQEPRDVAWGEGSTDEMCLSTLFLTGP